MKLQLLFLIQLLKLSSSTDLVDKTADAYRSGFTVYNGFPMAILCDQFNLQSVESLDEDFEGSGDFNYPDYSDETQCVITRDGETLLNETFIWEDAPEKGIFETPDDTWNGNEISVLVKWPAGPEDGQLFVLTMNVKESNEYSCPNVTGETNNEDPEIGEEAVISCFFPQGMYMSENQFNTITTVWYHNCEEIERDNVDFEYEEVEYSFHVLDGIEFDRLKIRNTSFSKTPGKYYCALKIASLELPSTGYEVCLKEQFTPNLPIIVVGQEEYKARPGSNLNVTCSGHTGTEPSSVSQDVRWYKYEEVNGTLIKDLKCVDSLSVSSADGNCSSVLHQNKKYCTPLSAEDLDNVGNDILDDNFIATYTLRDVTKADSGIYICELVTTQPRFSDNFTVVVEEDIEARKNETKNELAIALGVVGGCILIAIVFILLFHVYMTPILYFLKHHFAPYETMDRQYISYLVYTPDVFNMENNMLEDTHQYFNRLSHPVYDPNKNADHAGARVGDQILETLRRCMTVVLFVTPDLLQLANDFNPDGNVNEDIFAVYQALENNVQNLDMRVVFICSKITKGNIDAHARIGNNFCVMLKRFMRRQANSVILWKANNQRAFGRALYVALPKLENRENQSEVIYNVAL